MTYRQWKVAWACYSGISLGFLVVNAAFQVWPGVAIWLFNLGLGIWRYRWTVRAEAEDRRQNAYRTMIRNRYFN